MRNCPGTGFQTHHTGRNQHGKKRESVLAADAEAALTAGSIDPLGGRAGRCLRAFKPGATRESYPFWVRRLSSKTIDRATSNGRPIHAPLLLPSTTFARLMASHGAAHLCACGSFIDREVTAVATDTPFELAKVECAESVTEPERQIVEPSPRQPCGLRHMQAAARTAHATETPDSSILRRDAATTVPAISRPRMRVRLWDSFP